MKFAEKPDLASVEKNIDKLAIDELEKILLGLNSLTSKVDKLHVDDNTKGVPTDLKKCNVEHKEVVRKYVYGELVKKVNVTETSGLVNKTDYDIEDIGDQRY